MALSWSGQVAADCCVSLTLNRRHTLSANYLTQGMAATVMPKARHSCAHGQPRLCPRHTMVVRLRPATVVPKTRHGCECCLRRIGWCKAVSDPYISEPLYLSTFRIHLTSPQHLGSVLPLHIWSHCTSPHLEPLYLSTFRSHCSLLHLGPKIPFDRGCIEEP
jgi:hypothetical protein